MFVTAEFGMINVFKLLFILLSGDTTERNAWISPREMTEMSIIYKIHRMLP